MSRRLSNALRFGFVGFGSDRGCDMRRRGRFIQYGPNYVPDEWHSTPSSRWKPPETKPRNHEVPQAWRKYAREPWRIIFPDLEWKPPEID
jgi:hypothetical protein